MKKLAPYLLSLFFMLSANIAIAANKTEEKEDKKLEKIAKEKEKLRTYDFILIDFLQPIKQEEKKLQQ